MKGLESWMQELVDGVLMLKIIIIVIIYILVIVNMPRLSVLPYCKYTNVDWWDKLTVNSCMEYGRRRIFYLLGIRTP